MTESILSEAPLPLNQAKTNATVPTSAGTNHNCNYSATIQIRVSDITALCCKEARYHRLCGSATYHGSRTHQRDPRAQGIYGQPR